ncbi:MAG: MafB family polymorphic toxin [Cardiobacteriaceae bacterium]|nr:MafB family polymorphic toxin [Cardiobacteriaceae bacterium]
MNKLLKFFLAYILTTTIGLNLSFADITTDPFLNSRINKEAFLPGGEYAKLGLLRGQVDNSSINSDIRIASIQGPIRTGNLETEIGVILGGVDYTAYFAGHGIDEHNQFTNQTGTLHGKDKQGSIDNGYSIYSFDYHGELVHPADAYLGGNPKGAYDNYHYKVCNNKSGHIKEAGKYTSSAITIKPVLVDNEKSFQQREKERLANLGNSLQGNSEKFLNPDLNVIGRAGTWIGENSANSVNALGGGEIPDLSVRIKDKLLLKAIDYASPDFAITLIHGNSSLSEDAVRAINKVNDLAEKYPNSAGILEGATALTGVTAVEKTLASNLVKPEFTTPSKEYKNYLVSEKFSDSYKDSSAKSGGSESITTSEGKANAATYPKLTNYYEKQNLINIAAQDPRLAKAVQGSGNENPNFSIGSGTRAEAEQLGQIWTGDGAQRISNGGLVSADGTMQYRPPTEKVNTPSQYNPTGSQANYEIFEYQTVPRTDKHGNIMLKPDGYPEMETIRTPVSNGHLIILD